MSSATTSRGRREVAAICAVQNSVGTVPGATRAARGLSHFGEHALGWIAIGAIGALLDRRNRREWIGVAAGAIGAHAASIVVKRLSRRRRPSDPAIVVGVSTPSQFSFPSSHATSTTAAAVLIGRIVGKPVAAAVVPPMLLSRLVLGVHYPSDVVVGSALGAASAVAVLKFQSTISAGEA